MAFETYVAPRRSELRELIRHYTDLAVDTGSSVLTRAAPVRAEPFLQITLEGRHVLRNVETGRIYEPPRATLIGLCTHRRYNLEICGRLRVFFVHLQPAALHAWTGLDMRRLTDDCLKGPRTFWNGLDDFADELARAPDLESRITIADEWFGALSRPHLDGVAAAARQIRDSHGLRGLDPAQHGLSVRQFQRRFARQVGVTPKTYARICRLAAVIDMRNAEAECSWTQLAYANGYSDQAHLTREFREIVGEAPTHFRGHRVHPPVAAGNFAKWGWRPASRAARCS